MPSIHLIRGQIVHNAIRHFHRNNPLIPSDATPREILRELLTVFNQQWEKAQDSLNALALRSGQLDFYRDDSELMLFNYSNWFYKNGMESPDLSEVRIRSEKLKLMGIIDAVHLIGDKVMLVDYKTSKHAKITDDIQRQAVLYALLYQDKYKKTPDEVLIHFLKEPDDPLPVHIDDEILEYGKILIESIRKKTTSQKKEDYKCKCGGYCERDFA